MDRLNSVSRGDGRPMLVLHGGRLDHRHMLDAIEPVFGGRPGWRRIYVDLPGCGGSTGFDHVRSQDDVLHEITGFAAGVTRGEPIALIGESRGSLLAQGLAYTRPEWITGVALLVPGGDRAESQAEIPPPVTLVDEERPMDDLDPVVRDRAERLVVRTPALVEKIRSTKLPAAAVHNVALEARVQESFAFSFHDTMIAQGFDRPSLIISGRQDSIAGYADAVAMLPAWPRATFALMDCAGHSLSWERPALFAALMHDWLERMEAS